jgi:oxygen-dependent protoporphyrinogen oxidase
VVVGGGISGLAAAHRVRELGRERGVPVDVTVLESSGRIGGLVRTDRIGEFLFEAGPDTLVAQKPAALRLCDRLGLTNAVVSLDTKRAGAEIALGGRLVPVPRGFLVMAPTRLRSLLASPLFSPYAKVRMAFEPWIAPAAHDAELHDESLGSFVTRRFGREVLDRVAEPILSGLYLGRAEDLSTRLTLPRFLEMERRDGSVLRALRRTARENASNGASNGHAPKSGFVAMDGGLARIMDALRARLPESAVRTSCRVDAVTRVEGGVSWRVHYSGAEAIEADAVILACPAWSSADALDDLDPAVSQRLAQLDYASCATVYLVYDRRTVGARLRGFGFFAPRSEGLPILACSYVSEKFERRSPADAVVLRVFLGGDARPEVLTEDDDSLVEMARASVEPLLRIGGRPTMTRVYRLPRSMPQFRVGHAESIVDVKRRLRNHGGLFVAGGAAGAVGLPDCIASGEEAAAEALSWATAYRASHTQPRLSPTQTAIAGS